MSNIVIPDGGTIGSASDTDAISVASNGEVTVNQSIKATTIKHTNGTSAITINTDGSVSGDFEGAMKFVGLGKVAINITSGTEGTDYPASGKTWIVNVMLSGYRVSSSMAGFGFGMPALILSRNSSGGWLQNDGSFSANFATSQPTSWIYRQPDPDDNSDTATRRVSDAFTAEVGQEGITGNTAGVDISDFAIPIYTFEISTK